MSAENFTIKVPSQFYVGLRSQGRDESTLPLGFATPYEPNTAAFEKRKSTVDNWTMQYRHQWDPVQKKNVEKPTIDPIIFDNVPMAGFKIAESVRRVYWGGGNVVWRIEDPRGFELEISSSNLARIIDCTTIENGVITVDCVWGRDKSQNVLLPVTSEPYKQAVKNTTRVSKKVALKDVSIGDIVVLKNGDTGEYAGAFNVITYEEKRDETRNRYDRNTTTEIKFFNVRRRYALRKVVTEEMSEKWEFKSSNMKTGDVFYTFTSDLSVSEITKKTDKPKNYLTDVQEFFGRSQRLYFFGIDGGFYITDKPVNGDMVKLTYLPVDKQEILSFIRAHTDKDYSIKPLLLLNKDRKITIQKRYSTSVGQAGGCTFNTTLLSIIDPFTVRYDNIRNHVHIGYDQTTDAEKTLVEMVEQGKVTKLAFNIDGTNYIPEGYF